MFLSLFLIGGGMSPLTSLLLVEMFAWFADVFHVKMLIFLLRRFNVDCSASERLYAGVEGAFAGVTGISGCMLLHVTCSKRS